MDAVGLLASIDGSACLCRAGADILAGGRRVMSARLVRAGYAFRHPTVDEAPRACASPD
ncbi:MAG: DUF1731 domain-containing protein [Pseudonocardia sp.]|nr:DUF1731 domain-containing protein [Pseudonocardia sp.]